MIDASALTSVLASVVKGWEDDLRVRADEVPEVGMLVRGEWESAKAAGRTDQSLEVWREGLFTQVAVGWVLASVFVRFSEDNGLIPEPLLSGPGNRRSIAEGGQTLFYRDHPEEGERGFLLNVFTRAAKLPGLAEVLGPHSPVWLFGPSNDACSDLLAMWRRVNPETGLLVWDFTDQAWDTRFLGDLYQDLSESARKTFALLQTPDFIEEFILDRTMDPAVDEFGLIGFRVIDPACGSGHFLLGAFARLFERWQERDPSAGSRALAARALDSVFGVDRNPFAVAIARFRLLVAALRAARIGTLAEAPVFSLNIAAGDSLLHGPPPGQLTMRIVDEQDPATRHLFATEDGDMVNRILSQKYHAVVANPPYITPKDKAANAAYRRRYETCKGKYALTVPFMERLFDLAIRGGPFETAGFVGQITGNSFTKREFGKKLIEEFLATEVDLTTIIDTSGAYIPGHGTPTVILFGRNSRPAGGTVRAVLGIKGEPSTPPDPAHGLVWTSTVTAVDHPGFEDQYVSADDIDRTRLNAHPWSLQGGAAQDLKAAIEDSHVRMGERLESVGFASFPGLDAAFAANHAALTRTGVPSNLIRPFVTGDSVRDYAIEPSTAAFVPYREDARPIPLDSGERWALRVWPMRTSMSAVTSFGGATRSELGDDWWTWYRWIPERYRSPVSIVFAAISTHNHFVLDLGGNAFKQSAPVIKLQPAATVVDHFELLGPLNSSVACLWMKQVFHNKGSHTDSAGARLTGSETWDNHYDLDASKLKGFPIPAGSALPWANLLDELAHEVADNLPIASISQETPSLPLLAEAQSDVAALRREMVSVQEELDWRVYYLYGLTTEDLSLSPDEAPPIEKGERAFEIVLARKMAGGEVKTTWFERHDSTPITELPDQWSESYRTLVERRLELIESDRFINLLERPEYKRRWNWDDWDTLEHQALEEWLLDRLEAPELWESGQARSVNQIADRLRTDAEFMQVAELYAKLPELDLTELIGKLVAGDAVPYLAAWRYTDSGLRKRAEWEKTWDLQRREDAGEDIDAIPVPPKYVTKDFRTKEAWKLRGKLDVPKERFVSYPGINRDTDPSLLIGWAGWDHLEQATALAGWYEQRRTVDGWNADRLTPILAGIAELVPWIKQWHNEPDPATGQRLGDFFDGFIATECATLGIPTTDLTTWQPPATKRKKRAKRTS